MSSLWTPDGERPVRRAPPGPAPTVGSLDDGDPELDELEQVTAEELAAVTTELLSAPAAAIIANHCVGLFQLAALHLSQDRPDLAEAALAIDAFAAVVEGLGERLGPDVGTLRDALAQIRLAFVQVQAARR